MTHEPENGSETARAGGRPEEGLFVILVRMVAKSGQAQEAVTVMAEQLQRIREAEATCLSITLHQDTVRPAQLMLYEVWTDEPSFDVFLAKASMADYLDQLDLLLESREITRWETAG